MWESPRGDGAAEAPSHARSLQHVSPHSVATAFGELGSSKGESMGLTAQAGKSSQLRPLVIPKTAQLA